MITEIEEIISLKTIIQEEKKKLFKENLLPNKKLEIGIMIEIPGTIKLIKYLQNEIDFFSLGTNDLIQYLLAVDRNNSSLSYLYNPFNPAVIESLQEILDEVSKIKKEITVCGEIASNGITALMLLGMGFTNFSMNPLSIVEIKRLFTTVDYLFLKNQVAILKKLKLKTKIKKVFINAISKQYPNIL
jgi:phosphotransferase system enzyme I (PtsI)